MADFFAPQSPIFISHAWSDGTAKFISHMKAAIEEQTLFNVWVDLLGIDQVIALDFPCCPSFCSEFCVQNFDDVVRRFREALCAASVIIVCLTPTYLTRPNCLRELRWALDFAASGKKRVILLPLHPAVTFGGVSKMTQPGSKRGLVFSSKDKSVKRITAAAVELLSHVNFRSQMTLPPCHELQVRARPAQCPSFGHAVVDEKCLRRHGRAISSKTTGSLRGRWMEGEVGGGRSICRGQAALSTAWLPVFWAT